MVTIPILKEKLRIKYLLDLIGQDKAYIMGGFVRYCCTEKETIKHAHDIDIYCYDQTVFDSMRKKLNEAGFTEHKKEYPVCVMFAKKGPVDFPLQLIKPIQDFNLKALGTMEEIIENFDFTVARIGVINENEAMADDDFIADATQKKLVIKFIHCPVSSMLRIMKYAKKGFSIRPFEIFKLFVDWEGRDNNYRQIIAELFLKSNKIGEDGKPEITDDEIEHMERLLRRD
jgi:hypothetical protein